MGCVRSCEVIIEVWRKGDEQRRRYRRMSGPQPPRRHVRAWSLRLIEVLRRETARGCGFRTERRWGRDRPPPEVLHVTRHSQRANGVVCLVFRVQHAAQQVTATGDHRPRRSNNCTGAQVRPPRLNVANVASHSPFPVLQHVSSHHASVQHPPHPDLGIAANGPTWRAVDHQEWTSGEYARCCARYLPVPAEPVRNVGTCAPLHFVVDHSHPSLPNPLL